MRCWVSHNNITEYGSKCCESSSTTKQILNIYFIVYGICSGVDHFTINKATFVAEMLLF